MVNCLHGSQQNANPVLLGIEKKPRSVPGDQQKKKAACLPAIGDDGALTIPVITCLVYGQRKVIYPDWLHFFFGFEQVHVLQSPEHPFLMADLS